MTGHCLMCGETGCNGCDIVERLRATPETGADPDMIFEAANEIERLRTALTEICEWTERYTTPNHPITVVAKRALDVVHNAEVKGGGK